ncbi:MAG: inositol monophosphatase family protein [Cytophagaceae bacterium]
MNLKQLTSDVCKLTSEVKLFVQQENRSFSTDKIELKGKSDLVSYVDKETEKLLVTGLSKLLPEAGFLTEEGTVKADEKEYIWVIDPLDGTTNFIHKFPSYSISIALCKNNVPIIGVVHEMNLDECFAAWKGGGAFCNGLKINISGINKIEDALIATGFPYRLLDKTDQYFDIIKECVKQSHGVRRIGSAAVDLAYVACGRFDAYFEFNLKPWDIAAGILLVQEAGGKVTDYSGGNDYIYGKEVLAAGHIHSEMLTLINKFWN